MDKSIQFHGAVLRSTYVDCQYSTIQICDYAVSVTLLKFLLSSRICGSSCCPLIKCSLSKDELRCEQEVDAASTCKRTTMCPLTISHVISRPIWTTWSRRSRSTRNYREIQDIVIWICSCYNCCKHILIAVCDPISWYLKIVPGNQRDIQVNSSASSRLDMPHYFVYANSVVLVPWFILIFNRLHISYWYTHRACETHMRVYCHQHTSRVILWRLTLGQ